MQTPVVVLCTGAWTRNLGRQLGRSWEISHVHGQALVTEAGPQQLNCHISSAAFFEDIQDDDQGVGAVLAVAQSMHGHFLLGEAGVVTSDTGSMVTPQGQAAIAVLAQRYFPWMHNLRILRGWAAPVAFTDDNLPFLGPVSGIEGLILATAFKSTVIVTPLVGETVAQLVTSGQTTLDLTPFSPDRTVSHGP
jgi:sarcosine oxidase subunit beta